MLPILLLAFVAIPILELAVILKVGALVGLWPTLLLLVADSMLGAALVRREGRRAWQAFRRALREGRWPSDEVAQGALVLVGGALLLTPGFVTDGVGLLLLLPVTRAAASRLLRRRLVASGRLRRHVDRSGRDVLDVQVMAVEPDDVRQSPADDVE